MKSKEIHLIQCKERVGVKLILSQDDLSPCSNGAQASFFPSKFICLMARPAGDVAAASPHNCVKKLNSLYRKISAASELVVDSHFVIPSVV